MSRIYTASFTAVAATAAQDLFEFVSASTAVILIHDISISQQTNVSDANEKELQIALKSGQTTTGSGGSTVTPVVLDFGDAATGATVKANNTTKATAGTIVTHYYWNWNVRGEFLRIFTPETRPMIRPSRRMTLELVNAPAASMTISGTITYEEIG
jgi:hypothetical protein